MRLTVGLAALFSYTTTTAGYIAGTNDHWFMGSQGINLWRLRQAKSAATQDHKAADATRAFDDFISATFEQPLDHFAKGNSPVFNQRYWFSTRHFNASRGGPVIVLDSGESPGEGRLRYLDTGIVDHLAEATGGLGVVLEHRYYGKSVPVLNLTTDSLRWLNNKQALADSANFMKHVKFPGISKDLTAPNTPWIYYGGSYAGARAAHMRVLYPDIVYGAIASSGVTRASVSFWEYYDIIRLSMDKTCSKNYEISIRAFDNILLSSNATRIHVLKDLFGVADLQHDDDVASLLSLPLSDWQGKNWDPALDSGTASFDAFCTALAQPAAENNTSIDTSGLSLPVVAVNYAQAIKKLVGEYCPSEYTIEECFGTYNDSLYQETSLSQTWRLWLFQVCTQWGFFMPAPPNKNYPRIVSLLNTLKSTSKTCHQAFPPGEYFTVPDLPDVNSVNKLGGFLISADRLAIIDGEYDPWRPATPHSPYAPPRKNTILRPFIQLSKAVHHWDENGLRNVSQEPAQIQNIHAEEISFVKSWLANWKKPAVKQQISNEN